MAAMLHERGLSVRLWGHRAGEIAELRAKGHPPGVPELRLPGIFLTTDLAAAVEGVRFAVAVVPSQALSRVAAQLAALPKPIPALVIASKGIDLETLRPLSAVVEGALPHTIVAVLSGPCIAREVAMGVPTSVVIACRHEGLGAEIQQIISAPSFRVYRQHDVLGVEYGGALKNVIAIAAGVGDGLGFGANSKSALLTRGLDEMRRLAMALGAEEATISGLSGLGDLCVTCFSPFSRNRRFGEALGRGSSVAEATALIGETVEGVPTAAAAVRIAAQHGIEVPIAYAVTQVVAAQWGPREAVTRLMGRELRAEF